MNKTEQYYGPCEPENCEPVGVSVKFDRVMDDLLMTAQAAREIHSDLMSKVDTLLGSEDCERDCQGVEAFGPGLVGEMLREISNLKDTLNHIKHHLDRL